MLNPGEYELTDTAIESTDSNKLDIYSKNCILVEPTTKKVAYEKNADERIFPASTTKLLTAILAVENCSLSDEVIITKEMTSYVPDGYTSAYLKPGETVTVEQLLNALLIPSGNDAGFALAIHISGSVDNFADLMNYKAKSIGCTNSHFTNPSGLHNVNHYSTARDMAIIRLKGFKLPTNNRYMF